MNKFVAMVGTNAKVSTNRTLLQFMKQHFADQAEIELMEITDLPLFNKPENSPVPAPVLAMAKEIDAADGVIIATPEYDHAVPSSLMNALEWLSHRVHPFVDKPVMIVGGVVWLIGVFAGTGPFAADSGFARTPSPNYAEFRIPFGALIRGV